MTKFLLNTTMFLMGFFISLNDLPRLAIYHYEIRIAWIFLPFALLIAITLKKIKHFSRLDLICIFYLLLNSIFVSSDKTRSLGFLVWFIFNLIICNIDSKFFGLGFLACVILGSIHIILQSYLPEYSFPPSTILNYVYDQRIVRPFSYWGEPSYAILNLSVGVFWIKTKYRQIIYLWLPILFVLFLSIFLTFSRLGLLIVGIEIMIEVLNTIREKKISKYLLVIVLSVIAFFTTKNLSISIQNNNFGNKIVKNSEVSLLKNGSEGERWISIKRGVITFQKNPLFGVGLGNSANYIKNNKIGSSYSTHYQGLHNLFLEIVVEIGLVGALFVFFCFFKKMEKISINNRQIFFKVMFLPMMFCQNINMPAMWASLVIARDSD